MASQQSTSSSGNVEMASDFELSPSNNQWVREIATSARNSTSRTLSPDPTLSRRTSYDLLYTWLDVPGGPHPLQYGLDGNRASNDSVDMAIEPIVNGECLDCNFSTRD